MSDDDWDPDAGTEDHGKRSGYHHHHANLKLKSQENKHANDDNDDDRDQLHAFYEEASDRKAPFPLPSSQEQEALSQHSAASTTNLSLAEMSRMEETLLSQKSHHEEEEDRQRQKQKRREDRARGIRAEKKPRRPPTEIQIKREKDYQRFKYKKGIDLSTEQDDVGGSMEYLMREKLGRQGEQRRLRALARDRRRRRKRRETIEEETASFLDLGDAIVKTEDNGDAVKKKTDEDSTDAATNKEGHGANWNFMKEGYVTMPKSEAQKLPYYIYHKQQPKRKRLSSVQEEDDDDGSLSSKVRESSSHCRQKKKKRRMIPVGDNLVQKQQNATASVASTQRGKSKATTSARQPKYLWNYSKRKSKRSLLAVDEPDNVTRSFPLQFNQVYPRMDLHGMIDTKATGLDRMVVSHGRNAKRLWTRMVAGGIMNTEKVTSFNDGDDDNDNKVKGKTEDDSISNVSSSSSNSSSSQSSTQSYQPTGVYSQSMSYGTTSVVGMQHVSDKNNNDNDEDDTNKEGNSIFRLMSMVHNLPKVTHRQQLLMKVAHELGVNRRLWEEELKSLVEGSTNDDINEEVGGNDLDSNNDKTKPLIFTPNERWALKSFLGVDGSISTPPSWMTDPTMPTHPIVLRKRMQSLRSSLLGRLRRRVQKEQKKVDAAIPLEKSISGANEGIEDTIPKLEGTANDAIETNENDSDCARSHDDKVKTEDIDGDNENSCDMKREPTASPEKDSLDLKEYSQSKEEEEGGPDDMIDTDANSLVEDTYKLLGSLIDEIQQIPDLGGVDKYAKLIHESNIDSSNINVALASFLDHLTSSKARLVEKQQMDSSHFQYRHELKLAQEDVGYWHETILSYLALAENLTQPRDANFYRSGNAFPESAPLAQAVMATQSYLANSGGVGCGRKKKSFQQSSWEVKNEEHSSEESDASEAENLDLETTTSGVNPSLLTNLEKKELRGIQQAAMEIAKRGKSHLAHNSLTSFTPIHLTTGIAIIADSVTPQAAELVSRSCCPDATDNRTPFDLISNMLAIIEEDGSLISPPQSSWNSRGKITDGMLVKSMYEAALVFRRCVETDPDDVDHWSWYVATFLGMLCIAFGKPSKSRDARVKAEPNETELQRDRPQLESFYEIRSNASIALADFVSFTKSHDCPMFHFAVTSMLEWKQAIILLHRPLSCAENEFGLEVRRLHAYHTYHWANKIRTESSVMKIQQLCDANLLPRDTLIDILASAVERNPCQRKNWARLVKTLGALPASKETGEEGLHEKQIEADGDQQWKTRQRVVDWEDEFFLTPKSAIKLVKPEFVRMVTTAVGNALPSTKSHQRDAHVAPGVATMPNPTECIRWICDPVQDNGVVFDQGAVVKDSMLPGSMMPRSDPDQELLPHDPACEALCMEIVVASHLMGAYHPFVCNSVWWLALKLWQSTDTLNGNENSFVDAISWLSSYGLDSSVYLRCRLNQSTEVSELSG